MSTIDTCLAQYKLSDSQNPDSAVLLAATDTHGRIVGSVGGIQPTDIRRAHVRVAAEAPMLGDKIFSAANELMVSDRVWKAVQAMSPTDHIHAIHTMVINTVREPIAKVWWLVPAQSHDALHRDLAHYRQRAGSGRIGRVMKWALDASQVPHAALWHEAHGRWFVSREFAEFWTSQRFMGARFDEVPTA